MSCTPDAVVCDDAVSAGPPTWLLLVEVAAGAVLLALLALVLLEVVRRRPARRPPVRRVHVDARGDVVRREP